MVLLIASNSGWRTLYAALALKQRFTFYARQDQIGTMYGWALLGFAGVSLIGLVASFALSKRNKPASAT